MHRHAHTFESPVCVRVRECVALSLRHTHARTLAMPADCPPYMLTPFSRFACVRFAPHCRPSANINYVRLKRFMCSIYLYLYVCVLADKLYTSSFLSVSVGGEWECIDFNVLSEWCATSPNNQTPHKKTNNLILTHICWVCAKVRIADAYNTCRTGCASVRSSRH